MFIIKIYENGYMKQYLQMNVKKYLLVKLLYIYMILLLIYV